MDLPPTAADEATYRARYEQATARLEGALLAQKLLTEQVAMLKDQLAQQRALHESGLAVSFQTQTRSTVSTDVVDVWLREQQYTRVAARFESLLYPRGSPCDSPSLVWFWDTIGGAEAWYDRHSAETLTLLLSRVERASLKMQEAYGNAQAHRFLEHVAARLPRLARLSLGGVAYSLDTSALPVGAFPALTSLDLSGSPITDDDLAAFAHAMPHLAELDVTGCTQLSWEAVTRTVAAVRGLRVTPTSAEAFAESLEERKLQMLYDRYVSANTIYLLVRLWQFLGGKDRWRESITAAKLTKLLSRSEITRVVINCGASDIQTSEYMDPHEVKSFVAQVVARLPKLELLQLNDCSEWPVDCSAAVAEGTAQPFPVLKRLCVRGTPWQPEDVLDVMAAIPSLERTGSANEALEVDQRCGPSNVDVVGLRQQCGMKLYVWAS